MPKYTFPDDGSAQHLAGVVVETSEEIADRIPGLKSGGSRKAATTEKRAAPQKSTQTATSDTRAAPQKTVTTKSTAPKSGG